MQAADISLGLALCRQAGWNQIEPDWRRFLAMEPRGCFVAELDGEPAATTVTCLFGPVAWIAMVLVETTIRRRGVATSLLKHALDFLDGRGARTVRLDATAAGQPVYERLGFTSEYRLTRYEGTAPITQASGCTAAATPTMYPQLVALDSRATGTYREKMLLRLFEESPDTTRVLWRDHQPEGFVATRLGVNAVQIGPCVATGHAGPLLLRDAMSDFAGRRVFIDVPRDNAAAVAAVEAADLKAQRDFTRMYRGERVADHPREIWAGSGPEKG